MEPKIVKIEWLDSKAWSEWISVQSVAAVSKERNVMSSVGFLIEKNGENVVIAQSQHEGYRAGLLKIPIPAILTTTVLLLVVLYSIRFSRAEAEKVLCSSFKTQEQAQAMIGTLPRLDGDKDGIACESLLK